MYPNSVDTAYARVVWFICEIEDALHDEYPVHMGCADPVPEKGMGAEAIPLLHTEDVLGVRNNIRTTVATNICGALSLIWTYVVMYRHDI